MPANAPLTFVSYCREDSAFALQLARDLKTAGAAVWIDQLDIHPGQRWDQAVEGALRDSPRMVVVLSPAAVSSNNVLDEVSYALETQKTVLPILYRDCEIPFRLRRVQRLDFRTDYSRMLQTLWRSLESDREPVPTQAQQDTPAAPATLAPALTAQPAPAAPSSDAKTPLNEEQVRMLIGSSRQEIETLLGKPNQIAGDLIMFLHPCVGFTCPYGIASSVEYYRPNTVTEGLDTGMTRAAIEQRFGPGAPPASGPDDWVGRSSEYPGLLPGYGLKVLYDDYNNPSAIATMIQVWQVSRPPFQER